MKSDALRLQIMRYFNNYVFMFEKRDVYGRQLFLDRWVSGPYNRLKILSASRSANRILLKRRGLEPKLKLFLHKNVQFRPHAVQTNAPQAYYKRSFGGQSLQPWVDFVILRQK